MMTRIPVVMMSSVSASVSLSKLLDQIYALRILLIDRTNEVELLYVKQGKLLWQVMILFAAGDYEPIYLTSLVQESSMQKHCVCCQSK